MDSFNKITTSLVLTCSSVFCFADHPNELDLFKLPLTDLLDIPVYSATPGEETQFSAPLAVGRLSYEDIRRSNVSNIPEALRLIPGLIVKEETNGNYDVYIRGLDSVPPGNAPVFSTNSSTLVMIDYQPVYNWFTGGIYWSGLGISLEDIESIEVVRGPASAMYGPNAANGVIHILTKRPTKAGWKHSVSLDVGSEGERLPRIRADYHSDHIDLSVHAHIDHRTRSNEKYYGYVSNQREVPEDLVIIGSGAPYLSQFPNAYPEPDRAIKEGGWGFNYGLKWSDDSSTLIDFRQYNTEFHDTIIENSATPLTYLNYEGESIYIRHKVDDFQISYARENSTQDLEGSAILDFDSSVEHAQISFDYHFDKLNIHSLASYSRAITDSALLLGSNNKKALSNSALGVYFDYQFNNDWRGIAAYRSENISIEEDQAQSYQLGLNYTPGKDHFLWLMNGEAFRSPFVLDSFTSLSTPPVGNTLLRFSGNDDLDLLTINETQLGWRYQLDSTSSFQLEAFYRKVRNFSSFVYLGAIPEGVNTAITYQWINVPTKASQRGITAESQWSVDDRLSIKMHMTWQDTMLNDRQEISGMSVPFDANHKGTPEWFGGVNSYWQVLDNTLLSLESYFVKSHRAEYGYGYTVTGSSPVNVSEDISSKLLVDLGMKHRITKGVDIKVSIKNLTNNDNNEFLYADPTPRKYVAQFHYSW